MCFETVAKISASRYPSLAFQNQNMETVEGTLFRLSIKKQHRRQKTHSSLASSKPSSYMGRGVVNCSS